MKGTIIPAQQLALAFEGRVQRQFWALVGQALALLQACLAVVPPPRSLPLVSPALVHSWQPAINLLVSLSHFQEWVLMIVHFQRLLDTCGNKTLRLCLLSGP